MSTIDDLNESLDNQDEFDDKFLEIIKKLNLKVTKLEERKKEREAKRFLLKNSPPSLVAEIAPKLLLIEKSDEEKLRNCIPGLQHATEPTIDAYNSTSGTASPYVSGAYNYVGTTAQPAPWLKSVMQPFTELAEYKSQKATIPNDLDKLYQGLGDKFSEALRSVEMARKELGNQSVSILAMRNFLQNFWGNLLDLARQTKPSIWVRVQKNGIGQSEVRDLVSKSLSNDHNDERKLVQLLQDMSDIFNEMSSNQVGKNLQFDNISLLNSLLTRWLLLIDGLVRFV